MKNQINSREGRELSSLCKMVKELAENGERRRCENLIYDAMSRYPHAPEPHNLIGVILEQEGDHTSAMRHFRAAWALDPSYLPARQNLNSFGTFYSSGGYAYDESDCVEETHREYTIEYDKLGIGHARRV